MFDNSHVVVKVIKTSGSISFAKRAFFHPLGNNVHSILSGGKNYICFMNKKKILALLVSASFLFAACGDDDSPSSPKNSQEEISSSSETDECDFDECSEKSSSSKKDDKKSSSSKKADKKSSDSKSSDSKVKSSSSSKDDSKSSSSVVKEEKSSSSVAKTDSSSSSENGDKKSSDSKSSDSKVKSSSSSKDDSKSSSSVVKDEKSSSSVAKSESSSSSVKGDKKSSSSVAKIESSSSSVKVEEKSSSSAETPVSSSSEESLLNSSRAAKLTDLEKNYELKLFDQTVYLSTGSKQGLIALRIPDELWVVTYTDFADGVVSFNDGNSGKQYSETDAAKKIVGELKNGFKISFVVDKSGRVWYSLNNTMDYSEAIKASVAVQKNKVSKAEAIKNKIYECADGDTARTFTFFDNSYIVDNYVGGNLVSWHGGHYDVQRSTLLMRPAYYNRSVYSMFTYSVGTDNTISASNGESTVTMNCNVESVEYEYENARDFVGEWHAKKDGIDWEFSIKADGTYEIFGFEGSKNVEAKNGVWEIYGYHLMMRNIGCLHPNECTTSIHGQLQAGTIDRETGKISGFSFIHHDPDTPKIPTSFEAPEYE